MHCIALHHITLLYITNRVSSLPISFRRTQKPASQQSISYVKSKPERSSDVPGQKEIIGRIRIANGNYSVGLIYAKDATFKPDLPLLHCYRNAVFEIKVWGEKNVMKKVIQGY